MAKNQLAQHKCSLEQKSKSGLPMLAPQTSKYYKFIRKVKKWFLVSEYHYLTSKLFRSSSMLVQERRRHIKTSSWYIIHPFSKLHIVIEILMTFAWAITLFVDVYVMGYYSADTRDDFVYTHHLYILEMIQVMYILSSFLLGYLEISTNEVILEPRRIAISYTSSFFIFDCVGCIPVTSLVMSAIPLDCPPTITITVGMIKCSRVVRLKTMLDYMRQITHFLNFSDTNHKIVCMIVLYVYFLHWCACLMYLIPRIDFFFNKVYSAESWIVQANIIEETVFWRYVISLHTAMCHFMCAGAGMFKINEPKDQLVCSMVTLFGYIYTAYMTAVVLQMVSSTSASESKYEELVHNLFEYSIRKKMPQMLKLRLLLYYENRFQKKYFRESAILSTLSEHLRYELLLHSCKHLFQKLTVFHGLSKVVLGTIIACLKQEVYLPNDVIMKADTPSECMYLVGYGTLALYTIDGLEIMHIEDGDHFGETGLLRPDTDKLLNVVAVETSEVFRLDKPDFFYILHRYDDFAQRMQKAVIEELAIVSKMQDHLSRLHGKHDILNDLRRGKILETCYRRHYNTIR